LAHENTKALRALVVLLLSTFLIGCAGKTADPVKVIQLTDRELSCGQVLSQMNQLDQEGRVLARKADKTGKNAALAVAGQMLLVPYLFMDLKEGEKVELNAVRARYMHLVKLYEKKEC
tara:strand:+ start:23 stop:376 length:354 start_codon:yes stop_codon:yes gene_type:complete